MLNFFDERVWYQGAHYMTAKPADVTKMRFENLRKALKGATSVLDALTVAKDHPFRHRVAKMVRALTDEIDYREQEAKRWGFDV